MIWGLFTTMDEERDYAFRLCNACCLTSGMPIVVSSPQIISTTDIVTASPCLWPT